MFAARSYNSRSVTDIRARDARRQTHPQEALVAAQRGEAVALTAAPPLLVGAQPLIHEAVGWRLGYARETQHPRVGDQPGDILRPAAPERIETDRAHRG